MKFFIKNFQKGTTLIEILVAATFLTLTAVGVLGVFTTGYLILHQTFAYHRATELAKLKMEELKNIGIEVLYPANEQRDLDGTNDKKLTEKMVVGTVLPGSDAVAYCSVCGYLNKFRCIDGNLLYTPTCMNQDRNFDGNENDPCGANLPLPGELGYYTRTVIVYAHKSEGWAEAQDDYDHYSPGDDPFARNALLKEIVIRLDWKIGKENQAFTLKSLFGLTTPKYGFR